MALTVEQLQKTINKLGYKWFTDWPNLTGIRSTLDEPDAFNDFFTLSFVIPTMPSGLSLLKQQAWLNTWAFKGANGKSLAEDGKPGSNTDHALAQYNTNKNKEILKTYPNTTNPGVYWLRNFNAREVMGTAVLKPGQWENCWSLGYHQQKKRGKTHRALIQTGEVTVYRDSNRDDKYQLNESGTSKGLFGINIHGSNKSGPSKQIGMWSAGCQVFPNWEHKEEVMNICEIFRNVTGNKFTYTLINEKDLA
jgi:hypothetical protein